MTRDQVKDTLEFVGVAAIVASLIFVGLQIRQNEESLKMQFLQGEMLSFQEHFGRVSENSDLAEALVIAEANPEELTPTQRKQVGTWLEEWLGFIATWQNLHDIGAFTTEEFDIRIRNNCYIYDRYLPLLDDIRPNFTFGFPVLDEVCTSAPRRVK
jgi:hypothetical protein